MNEEWRKLILGFLHPSPLIAGQHKPTFPWWLALPFILSQAWWNCWLILRSMFIRFLPLWPHYVLWCSLQAGAMSSGNYSANNKRDDGHGPGGWQYPSSYNDLQQPPQDGMTTQPSVGRFTEKLKANCMFVRKPATPTMVPRKDSSSQSGSSDIVNLNAAPGAERKVSHSHSNHLLCQLCWVGQKNAIKVAINQPKFPNDNTVESSRRTLTKFSYRRWTKTIRRERNDGFRTEVRMRLIFVFQVCSVGTDIPFKGILDWSPLRFLHQRSLFNRKQWQLIYLSFSEVKLTQTSCCFESIESYSSVFHRWKCAY